MEDYRTQAPPHARFPEKLNAFVRNQIWGWFWNYVKFRFGPRHRFQTYSGSGDNGIYPLACSPHDKSADESADAPIRLSVAGDWASGTAEAELIAELMERSEPHFTIHLGDVYYVGDEDEMRTNCLGRRVKWPIGSMGSFALNGNHEMYANGHAYFDTLLPALGMRQVGGALAGQKASYFCLRNRYWDVIAIDTGYNSVGLPLLEMLPWFIPSCKLRREQLHWLRDVVKPRESRRGIVLLSHHQNVSAFEDVFTRPAQQLAEFIERPVLWLWGHEHRFAVYGKASTAGGIESYGRCLGHGGMPVDIRFPVRRPEFPLVVYDDRLHATLRGLEVGFNGFSTLTFRGNTLVIEHRDIKNQLLLEEHWETDAGMLRGTKIERGVTASNIKTPAALGVAIGKTP